MKDLNAATERMEYLLNTIPALLAAMPEDTFALKPALNKWSKKEILGHLIDSATNNHQRFVRGQFEEVPFIVYDQDGWNDNSRYNEMPAAHVIGFWELYNRHLLELIKRIPEHALLRKCLTNEPEPVTLEWLITDYVAHMEHHLKQVVQYN
jgi:hypothetical protein